MSRCKGVASTRYPDYEAFGCELEPGHLGAHRSGETTWTDSMLVWDEDADELRALPDYPEWSA